MIPKGARVKVADNSGAIIAEIFGIYGGSGRMDCRIGDFVKVAIKKAIPNAKVKSGEVYLGIVVRSKWKTRRKNGHVVSAGDNAIVLLNEQKTPIGTRISGCVAQEILAHPNENIRKMAPLCEEIY